ncbi:hypothetical protein B0J14DRAFT_652264 [Halenospora varia]|nr:hypothetical protein B0J14DRAFT_652264 [Halenospora varia]
MSSPTKNTIPSTADLAFDSMRKAGQPGANLSSLPMPNLSGPANSAIGNLLKGPVHDDGRLKDAGVLIGIKLDIEAEVHLTARVRGDIVIGLY